MTHAFTATMNLADELLGIVDALDAAGIHYAVCGGLAVAIHGHARMTKDIDVLIRREDLDRVREVLKGRGFVLEAGSIHFARGTSEQREVFRTSKPDGDDLLTVDLLIAGPALAEVYASRVLVAWRDRRMQVVSRAGLAKMKRLAGREQDLLDLKELGLDGE